MVIVLFILKMLKDKGTQVLTNSSHPSCSLEKMGALNWAKVAYQHQGWRLISCMWLHAGLIHLVINMLSLLFIGIRLEQQFGYGKLHTSAELVHFTIFAENVFY
jgi:membrane associated rhomboid family serine protease